MKYAIVLLLILVSCTSIQKDPSGLSDQDAKFESLLTNIGENFHYGNAIYYILTDESLLGETLNVATIFNGTYSVKSKNQESCNVNINGRYSDSDTIIVPLDQIFKESAQEKLCTIVIQLNPEVTDSTVVIHPRYSIVRIHISDRVSNSSISKKLKAGQAMEPVEVSANVCTDYQIVKKCTYSDQATVVASGQCDEGLILTQKLLQLDTNIIGNCYFSVLYKNDDGTHRFGYSLNIYYREFENLKLSTNAGDSKVKVEGPDYMYVCGIGDSIHTGKYKCNKKLNDLSGKYIIQGHTNTRSSYIFKVQDYE